VEGRQQKVKNKDFSFLGVIKEVKAESNLPAPSPSPSRFHTTPLELGTHLCPPNPSSNLC
jgi:hypothetical protein